LTRSSLLWFAGARHQKQDFCCPFRASAARKALSPSEARLEALSPKAFRNRSSRGPLQPNHALDRAASSRGLIGQLLTRDAHSSKTFERAPVLLNPGALLP
jgi:hypothetical protein